MDKLDPALRRLIAMHACAALGSGESDSLTHVYVATEAGDFSGLEAAGFAPAAQLGDTAVVVLPIDQIHSLAAREDVASVFAPVTGKPGSDARHYTYAQEFATLESAYAVKSKTRVNGTKGEGVFVGIVDSGVNILHTAFRTAAANPRTRIAWLWVPFGTVRSGTTPLWERWGTVFNEAQLNAIIDQVMAKKKLTQVLIDLGHAADAATAKTIADKLLDLEADDSAAEGKNRVSDHGTAVASIAAGTPFRPLAAPWRPSPADAGRLYGGVASEAKLIVVAGYEDVTAASEFCFDKADAVPCVVNMSIYTSLQPHNGKSVFYDRVRAKLNARAGRAFVTIAGNQGEVHKHALVQAPQTLTIFIPHWNVSWFEIFVSSAQLLTLEIAPPPSISWMHRTPQFYTASATDHFNNSITFDLYGPRGQGDGEVHKSIRVSGATRPSLPYVSSGDWTLKINGTSSTVHVWLWTSGKGHDDDARIKPLAGATPSAEDTANDAEWQRPASWIQHSVSGYGCGADFITVANTATEMGRYAVDVYGTSRGPTTDSGRATADTKPDLAAPGEKVRGAIWNASTRAGPPGLSRTGLFTGTSMAAPHVAGAVALMLSHDPTLDHAKIRRILRTQRKSVDPDTITTWQNSNIRAQDFVGQGYLDIALVLEEVTRNNKP